MAISLLRYERIETTEAKAKELRRIAERLITMGKRGDLHARRRAFAILRNKETTTKLFDDIAARYTERNGGYTRLIKLDRRAGDNAPLSIIELVERKIEVKDDKPKEKKGLGRKMKEAIKGGEKESVK